MTAITASHRVVFAPATPKTAHHEDATAVLPPALEPAIAFDEVGEDMRTAGTVVALTVLVLSAAIAAAVLIGA